MERNSNINLGKESSGEQSEAWQDMWQEYPNSLTNEQILDGDFDTNKLTRSVEDFHVNESDYRIITKQTVCVIPERKNEEQQYVKRETSIDEAASLIVGRTQALIYAIDSLDQEKEPFPDEIIYLDKSGRPVSWLVNIFWDNFAQKNSDGIVNKRPPHSYINIDRARILERFFGMTILEGDSAKTPDGVRYNYFSEAWGDNKNKLKDEHLAQLRALYLDEELTPDISPEEIMQKSARLDGKNILIIDEVASTQSTTLDMAKTLFEKAFRDCNVRTRAFWHEPADHSVPVWYDRHNVEGRGTGEINPPYYEEQLEYYLDEENLRKHFGLSEEKVAEFQGRMVSKAVRKYYGRNLLSTPLDLSRERDELSRDLLKDFVQLHIDYEKHHIVPYFNTKMDDRAFIEIVRQGVNPGRRGSIADQVFDAEHQRIVNP